jgi:hypothetical protein
MSIGSRGRAAGRRHGVCVRAIGEDRASTGPMIRTAMAKVDLRT